MMVPALPTLCGGHSETF